MDRSYKLFSFFLMSVLLTMFIGGGQVLALGEKKVPIEAYEGANEYKEPIVIGASKDCTKLYMKNDGLYGGYVYEFLEGIRAETGLIFIYKTDTREGLLEGLQSGRIDVVIGNNENFKSYDMYVLSDPLDVKSDWICSTLDFQSLLDIENLKVGFVKGRQDYMELRRIYNVNLKPIFFENAEAMMEGLIAGETEAILISDGLNNNQRLNDYHINRNFKLQKLSSETTAMATKEHEPLIGLINATLSQLGDSIEVLKEESLIEYLRYDLIRNNILDPFIVEEKLTVGFMKDYLPYDYYHSNTYNGISAGLVDIFGKVLNRKVVLEAYNNQGEMWRDFEAGNLDLITSGSVYDTRNIVGANFSEMYSSSNVAVVGRIGSRQVIYQLFDLEGSVIALVEDSWQEQLLVNNRINFQPIYVNNIHQALDMVNNGNAMYCIDTELAMSFLTRSYQYEQLTTISELDIVGKKYFIYKSTNGDLGNVIDAVIKKTNLDEIEKDGLEVSYKGFYGYDIFAILTVLLFTFLIAVGIYILVLVNRLNSEKRNAQLANDSKSEFLAKMSHEIRTPLTAIMGYVNLVSRSNSLTEVEQDQLNIAKNSSNILLNLVNDILDFSKIEAGKMQLVNQPFNVKAMIGNVANIIHISAEHKNLTFNIKISDDLPEYVIGDERRLEQVLINVLSNAVKFTNEGKVDLIVGASVYKDYVRINYTIEDTGKGMEQDSIDSVFEAFEQEDNSISRQYGGTGLGLYITKEFVTKMGGEIHVISSVGKGTLFSFYTIHQQAVTPLNDDGDRRLLTTEHLVGKKVLLAEDNDINQLIIKDILISMGLKVVVTSNGLEALEVASDAFDYIFLDIQMPVMDGLTAVKMMKKNPVLDRVPVIALTANVLSEQIESYYKAGFDGFCSKPVEINELTRMLLENYH